MKHNNQCVYSYNFTEKVQCEAVAYHCVCATEPYEAQKTQTSLFRVHVPVPGGDDGPINRNRSRNIVIVSLV